VNGLDAFRGAGGNIAHWTRRILPIVAIASGLALVFSLAPSTAPPSASGATGFHLSLGGEESAPCARSLDLNDLSACQVKWTGGNNGGATWPGVTAKSINIVAYNAPDNALIAGLLGGEGPGKLIGTPQEEAHALEVYTKWFNEHFQTYGRHVNVIPFNSAGTLQNQSSQGRADAVAIEKQDHAFLTIGGQIDESFFTQLAAEHIVSIAGAQLPESFYKANAPYIFGMLPTTDDQDAFISAFICNQLGPDSVAFFGGDNSNPPVNGQPRRYAIVYPTTNADGTPSVYAHSAQDLAARLSKCGIHVDPRDEISYSLDPTTAVSQVQAGSTRLIHDHVTTVVCLCDPISPTFSASSAASQGYFPEEIETGYLLQDYYQLDQLYNQEEWKHVFGVSSLPAASSPQDSLYWQAYKSIDPTGEPNPDDQLLFYELLLAFDGIQNAGPDLNPQTFAKAMFTKVRIYSTSPYVPTFYYTPNDYGGIKDAQIVWWNPDAPAPDGKNGNFESVDGGYRFTVKDWPKVPGKELFDNMACTQLGSCGLPNYPPPTPSTTTTTHLPPAPTTTTGLP
jgi:hypothetical protein